MAVQNLSTAQYDYLLTEQARGDFNDINTFTFKQICPLLDTRNHKGKLSIMDSEWSLRLHERTDLITGGGDVEPFVLAAEFGDKSVLINTYHLASEINSEMLRQYEEQRKTSTKLQSKVPPVPPDQLARELLVHQMMSIMEKHWLDTVTTNTNYNASNYTTLAAADRFDNDDVNPMTTFDSASDAIELACGRAINGALMNRYIWRRLRKNPYLRSALGMGDNLVSVEAFETEILNGGKIVFTDGRYWDGNEGATSPTGKTRMNGNDLVLFYRNTDATKGLMPGMLPKTFYSCMSLMDENMKVFKRPFLNNPEGYYVILRHSWTFVNSSPDTVSADKVDTGYLIETCVS